MAWKIPSLKKKNKKKRPKLRHTHMKRAVPHRSFGPCKWIGKRRFKVKFKIYRLRGQLKRRRLLHTLMLARSRRPVQNMTQYHATCCDTWFSQVVRWVCGWLGFEASNPGPAGSRTTKRKAEQEAEYHDDANLAQTLLTVLQNYQGQQSMLILVPGKSLVLTLDPTTVSSSDQTQSPFSLKL